MRRMGSWGVAIFSNDDSADIREDFPELIASGLDAVTATERLRAEYGPESPDDHDFWLALAATQHRTGHVVPAVIERALQIIEDPAELERWTIRERPRRAAALSRLADQLRQPPPLPKRIRPRKKNVTSLLLGQHIVLPATDSTPELVFRVVGIHADRGGQHPKLQALEWRSRRDFARANRLTPIIDPWPEALPYRDKRVGGFSFMMLGPDPLDLVILPAVTDDQTPSRPVKNWKTARWGDPGSLSAYFDRKGRPVGPRRPTTPG